MKEREMNQRNERPSAISADLRASFHAELEGGQYAPGTINFYLQAVVELGRVHGEFVNHAAIGIWNRPRQWCRHA
jgi:hypothetical protein